MQRDRIASLPPPAPALAAFAAIHNTPRHSPHDRRVEALMKLLTDARGPLIGTLLDQVRSTDEWALRLVTRCDLPESHNACPAHWAELAQELAARHDSLTTCSLRYADWSDALAARITTHASEQIALALLLTPTALLCRAVRCFTSTERRFRGPAGPSFILSASLRVQQEDATLEHHVRSVLCRLPEISQRHPLALATLEMIARASAAQPLRPGRPARLAEDALHSALSGTLAAAGPHDLSAAIGRLLDDEYGLLQATPAASLLAQSCELLASAAQQPSSPAGLARSVSFGALPGGDLRGQVLNFDHALEAVSALAQGALGRTPEEIVSYLNTLDLCDEDALVWAARIARARTPETAYCGIAPDDWRALGEVLDRREQAQARGQLRLAELAQALTDALPDLSEHEAGLACALMKPALRARVLRAFGAGEAIEPTALMSALTPDSALGRHSLDSADFARRLKDTQPPVSDFLRSLIAAAIAGGVRVSAPADEMSQAIEAAFAEALTTTAPIETPASHILSALLDALGATLSEHATLWRETPAQGWLQRARSQGAALLEKLPQLEADADALQLGGAIARALVKEAALGTRGTAGEAAFERYRTLPTTARRRVRRTLLSSAGALSSEPGATLDRLADAHQPERRQLAASVRAFCQRVQAEGAPAKPAGPTEPDRDMALLEAAMAQILTERNNTAGTQEQHIDAYLASLPMRGSAQRRTQAVLGQIRSRPAAFLMALGDEIEARDGAKNLDPTAFVRYRKRSGIEDSYLAQYLELLLKEGAPATRPTAFHHIRATAKAFLAGAGYEVHQNLPGGRATIDTIALNVDVLAAIACAIKPPAPTTPLGEQPAYSAILRAAQRYQSRCAQINAIPEIGDSLRVAWINALQTTGSRIEADQTILDTIDSPPLPPGILAPGITTMMLSQKPSFDAAKKSGAAIAPLRSLMDTIDEDDFGEVRATLGDTLLREVCMTALQLLSQDDTKQAPAASDIKR